ncbi:MAG: uracil-DNA glycosylase family protein [Minwuia sp.]|nr:uracil-DNA glycosylase family protein [Minwuia sp.]
MTETLESLLQDIRACRICESALPHGVRPVVAATRRARILIAGHAPGMRVHRSGIPWDDPSGDRLRTWLGVDRATFYEPTRFAIVPMGFCYPGTVKGAGDLPPRPECAATWHDRLMQQLPAVAFTLVLGQYAINWHLGDRREKTLTATVAAWRDHMPSHLPLPHPSGRNNGWLARNPWFETDVVPALRARVQGLLNT